MINFKQKILCFLFLCLFSKNSFALHPACYDFIESLPSISNNNKELRWTWDVITEFEDFGISFNYDPPKETDFKSTEFLSKIRRDEHGYPLIGLISHSPYLEHFRTDDVLISVDGKDLKKMSDEEIKEIFYYPDKDNISVTYIDSNQNLKKVLLEKIIYEKTYKIIDFFLESINEIDIVNSSVEFSASINLRREYDDIEDFPFVSLAKKHLANFKNGQWHSEDCQGISSELAEKHRLFFPGESLAFENLLYEDKNLVERAINLGFLTSSDNKKDLYFNIDGYTSGTWEVRNEFNLLSFPFDKQKIKIQIIDTADFDENYLEFSDISYRVLNLTDENSIPGWKITESGITLANNIETGNLVFNEGTIEFEIERESFYYIYKIILPIMLILTVCWSSVWLDRKELESKLTITIVCLLSLIAYNFVIDNELPKLNYLTVMDWIILTSYLYASAPNILAIISFQLSKTKKNNLLEQQISYYSKRFGILSYFLIVIIIILINVNNVPENTIDALSWAYKK